MGTLLVLVDELLEYEQHWHLQGECPQHSSVCHQQARLRALPVHLDELFTIAHSTYDCRPWHMQGWACRQYPAEGQPADCSLAPLLDAVVEHVPPPNGDPAGEFKMLVTMLEADAFVGRIATGRVASGTARLGDRLRVITRDGAPFSTLGTLRFQCT